MIHRFLSVSAPLLVFISAVARGEDSFVGRTPKEWSEQLSSSKGQGRIEAAWAIAQIAGRGALDAQDTTFEGTLKRLIEDREASVRYWGVQGLAMYARRVGEKAGGRAVVIQSLQTLLNDKSPAPRIAAAESLGLLGQADKGLPVLVAAMDDPQESVRIQAVAALEKLGPAARPAMGTLEKATSDSSEYVKRISERALTALDSGRKPSPPKAKAGKAKSKAKT